MDLFLKQCNGILGCLSKNLLMSSFFPNKTPTSLSIPHSSRLLGKQLPPSGQRWDGLEGITQFLLLVIGSEVGMWPNPGQ